MKTPAKSPVNNPIHPNKVGEIRGVPLPAGQGPVKTAGAAKPAKHGKPFGKSRDNHEDRGERQMKTTHNPQTFPHGK